MWGRMYLGIAVGIAVSWRTSQNVIRTTLIQSVEAKFSSKFISRKFVSGNYSMAMFNVDVQMDDDDFLDLY